VVTPSDGHLEMISQSQQTLVDLDDNGAQLLSAEIARYIGTKIVASLLASGVAPGDFVVFQAVNSVNLLSGVYGSLLAGFAPIVIGEKLSERERNDILSSVPSPVIVTNDMLEVFAKNTVSSDTVLATVFACRPVHFTSGTSGKPKGVWSGWLSEQEANDLAGEERVAWDFDASDVHLVNGPLSHSAPLRFSLQTLLNGGLVIVPPRFDSAQARSFIESGLATTTFMAPIHMQRILDSAPLKATSLRLLAHAGSPCPDRVRRMAIEQFGLESLVEFYGSTEGQFTICNAREWLQREGTVGRARQRRELRVDSDQRIWCKVPHYARFEYLGDEAQTEAAWDGDWFTVNDVGRMDDDGYLYLETRRTDLIITGGVNVYPAEIERVLLELPSIEIAAAFGVEDAEWGQRVCLAYVGTATREEILAFCASNLAPYKHPKTILVVAELPTTHSGKINRRALSSLVES
jgi:long-chain acyl-CoA synthetase